VALGKTTQCNAAFQFHVPTGYERLCMNANEIQPCLIPILSNVFPT